MYTSPRPTSVSAGLGEPPLIVKITVPAGVPAPVTVAVNDGFVG